MVVTYDIYRRYAERDRTDLLIPMEEDMYYGKRYKLIENYTTFSITLNFRKENKFQIKGTNVAKCPLEIGDTILIYRNAELLMTGLVKNTKVQCNDVETNTFNWEADGVDESVIFDWRVILTDYDQEKGFQDLTFDNETYDKCEDYAYDRMIHYIRNCFDKDLTQKGREIADMHFPKSSSDDNIPEEDRGEKELSAFRLNMLSSVLKDIGEEYNLFPKYVWDPITARKEITIPIQRDLSGMNENKTYDVNKLIVISPEFGNVSKWTKTNRYPLFNAVWVCSGNYTESEETPQETWENPNVSETKDYDVRVWVYAEDRESIAKYGRIEKIVSKADVKITEDDEETEEDETLTKEEVVALLEDEARKQLQENAAKERYSITLAPTEDFVFMKDWRCGDKVKAVINKKAFAATIETVTIVYSHKKETVTPTIGTVEEGIFSEVFEMINGIDRRLRVQEEK